MFYLLEGSGLGCYVLGIPMLKFLFQSIFFYPEPMLYSIIIYLPIYIPQLLNYIVPIIFHCLSTNVQLAHL